MALTNKDGLGSADAGCPITPQGDCVLNGMPVSCSIIRECDSITGNLHYEYAMPYSTGNVNINVADTQGNLIGYNDQQGRFVDTANVPISSLTNAPSLANRTAYVKTQAEQAQAGALAEGQLMGYTGSNLASYVARETATAIARLNNVQWTNTQAGQVTGAIVNTPQTTTSQQGTPGAARVNNTNAGTHGGNNSVTPTGQTINTTGMNFSSLISAGSDWWDGQTWGIDNKWLAIGAALAVAVGGGYVGGKTRRGF